MKSGTFKSDISGTFVSDTSGTFGVIYSPKASLYKVSKYVHSGDMVCFATTIKGLDVSHVGFAYWKDGKLTFIHASSSAKKVIVNPEPMQSYIDGVNHNHGVLFVRAIE